MIPMHRNMAAQGFSALGNETRIEIFRLLVQAGENGLSTGRIASELDIPLSTLAHHLDALTRAKLVNQRKSGRAVMNTANYSVMRALIDYLTEKCCQGLPEGFPANTSSETLEESNRESIST